MAAKKKDVYSKPPKGKRTSMHSMKRAMGYKRSK